MRVISKWCEELTKYFDGKYILNKETPFRLKNGSEKYLDKHAAYYLNFLL